jgi:hypothetical protein
MKIIKDDKLVRKLGSRLDMSNFEFDELTERKSKNKIYISQSIHGDNVCIYIREEFVNFVCLVTNEKIDDELLKFFKNFGFNMYEN